MMKETVFYIILNIKTAGGVTSVGKFFIGNDTYTANKIFQGLKGTRNVDEKTMLSLELTESVNGLPVNINMISCTLEELAENCRTITKEVFKVLNMKEML